MCRGTWDNGLKHGKAIISYPDGSKEEGNAKTTKYISFPKKKYIIFMKIKN